MKLVCYFKWADGSTWYNLKILEFHINVSLQKAKLFKFNDDNGALPAVV